jgi:PPP family 3-phenylpropionic acid transporter
MLDSPFYTLMDGYTVSFTHQNNFKYSSLRIFGSLAYVFGNVLGGLTIDLLGYETTFIISALFMIVTGCMLFLTKPLQLDKITENKSVEKSSYKEVLKNPRFYIYTLIYIGIVTISGIGDNFISLYFANQGLGTKEYGFIASGIIILEVLTMYLYSKFGHKVKDQTVYLIVGVTYALRSLLIGLNCPLLVTIPASFLRGVAWGLILCVHVNYLRKIVGTKNITNAIFLLVLISSIVQLVGLNLFGELIEIQGYSFVYLMLAIITLAITVFVFFNNLVLRKNHN